MGKTFRTNKRFNDDDEFSVENIKNRRELRQERRNRQVRHEMKATDLVRFDKTVPVEYEDTD